MRKTWPNPGWIVLAILLTHCGGIGHDDPGPEAPVAVNPPVTQPVQTNFAPAPIPIQLTATPTAFPYSPAGLRFQAGVVSASSQQPFKPISGLAMNVQGDVALAFAHLDVVAWFPAPRYEANLLGLPTWGGNGEPIQAPQSLWLEETGLIVHSQGNGLLSTFQLDGELIQARSVAGNPVAGNPVADELVVGPKGTYLKPDPQRPHVYLLYAPEQQAPRRIVLPQTGDEIRAHGGLRWSFAANGSLAVMRKDLGFIARFDATGNLEHIYRLEGEGTGLDIALDEDKLWLLVGDAFAPQLLTLTTDGQVLDLWQLPQAADRLIKRADQWFFVHRGRGAAVRYAP